MFKQLQRKLTLTYSFWFFLTLAAIFFILFFVFKSMIYQSVSWQVDDLAHDQALEFAETHHLEGGPFRHSLFLSAFLSEDGKDIVYRGSLPSDLRSVLLSKLKDRDHTGVLQTTASSGRKTVIIYALEPVVEDGVQNGHIVIAKDIIKTHEQIEWWFRILFLLGICTASLSVIIAHFLARRAVLPVKSNFEKQRAFVADASHEMRTPLSVFSASLEFFEAEEKGRLSESSKETLTDLKAEVKDMNSLISQLLSLARADNDGMASEKKKFPLIRMVLPMVSFYNQKALDEGKVLISKLPERELYLLANPVEIKQLLTIFLDNALKYTKKKDRIELKIWPNEEKHQFCFSVGDSGIGIPDEERKHIFERFYRVEKGRTRQNGGSGLGLSIANEIVSAYKGTITVEGAMKVGTIFTIRLPVLKITE
ncbi:HAMP domain-containing histidine kinase [Sporolactobacillus shoreae]|uniref:histidine kinase n=1 Tax=Sporolactobacillus shoreae TaxID=1465501 RepID=A0A4Z0GTP8_9BACL|nr:HAMP domain-containing sensor histidine kinase [Sporolactobacillus shoreae]TGB00351.1 HAMP domain-containing histidine kinase [Sporolactobacillus shoreae]